jgi:hypothetical protein
MGLQITCQILAGGTLIQEERGVGLAVSFVCPFFTNSLCLCRNVSSVLLEDALKRGAEPGRLERAGRRVTGLTGRLSSILLLQIPGKRPRSLCRWRACAGATNTNHKERTQKSRVGMGYIVIISVGVLEA